MRAGGCALASMADPRWILEPFSADLTIRVDADDHRNAETVALMNRIEHEVELTKKTRKL